jgi:hypothetical protein
MPYFVALTISSHAILYYLIFALYCVVDMKQSSMVIMRLYFIGALSLGLWLHPLQAISVGLAVGWGTIGWMNFLLPILLFSPYALPVLFYSYASRNGRLMGGTDILALASIGCIYSWPAMVSSVLGLEVWRRWWRYRFPQDAYCPGYPGLFAGLSVYLIANLALRYFHIPYGF